MAEDNEDFSGPVRMYAESGAQDSLLIYKRSDGTEIWRVSEGGRWVARKCSAPDDLPAYELLKREYDIVSKLSHPGIVAVYDFENGENRCGLLSMEYIQGRALDKWLKEKHNVAQRKRILFQILDTLSYIHRNNVVHNDLKPSNIMITENGDYSKIIDFGMADADSQYFMRTPGCSVKWASPELSSLSRESRIDCKSDIWSMGLIIKEILPHKYHQIVRKCLNPDPDKRYCDCEALKHAILRKEKMHRLSSIALSLAILAGLILAFLIRTGQRSQSYNEDLKAFTDSLKAKEEARQESIARHNERVKRFTDSLKAEEKAREERNAALEIEIKERYRKEYEALRSKVDKIDTNVAKDKYDQFDEACRIMKKIDSEYRNTDLRFLSEKQRSYYLGKISEELHL